MNIKDVAPGDVVWRWYDTGCMGGDIQYCRIIKINPKTLTVEFEHHGIHRVKIYEDGYIHFDGKISKTAWSPWNKEGV